MERHALIPGDCLKGLTALAEGSVDLVFADPPFNIGYNYDVYDDRKSEQAYLDWTEKWGRGIWRALKPTGTFWLAIGDDFAAELKVLFEKKIGFRCRSWVIWYYTFGVNCTRKFSRSHTHLFHFVKDPKNFKFFADDIRVPSARQLVYADSRAYSKGRLPDDTWILRPQDLQRGFEPHEDTWYFPRVCGTFKERAGFHGCQMPERLLERIIKTSSKPGDVVLDPFAGSGSTLVVAKKLCRQCIGFELSPNYARKIKRRLNETYEGQPLEGATEPKFSAPSTANGSPLETTNRTQGDECVPRIRGKGAVIEAFLIARDGFPVDRVVADPDLNAEFLAVCRRFGIPGEPVAWNIQLMNLRKSGQLKGLPRSRKTTFSEPDEDRYSFACEIAIQHFVKDGCTLDHLLCDPEKAAAFDAFVRSIIGQQIPSLLMRWTALKIRKRAKDIRRTTRQIQSAVDLPPRRLFAVDLNLEKVPARPGIYWLDTENRKLYIGETINLQERFRIQLRQTNFDFWQTAQGSLQIRYRELDDGDRHRVRQGNQSIWIGKWRPLGNYEKLAAL
jgi:DNA modification methylase